MTRSRARTCMQRAVGALGLVITGAALMSLLPGTVGSAGAVTSIKLAGRAANVAVTVPYAGPCYSSRTAAVGAACQRALVADIDAGRAKEHLRPLVLPRGFSALSAAQQVLVVTDLERVARRLTPIAGLNTALDARAARGAVADDDPTIAGWNLGTLRGQVWTSVQATVANALEADWLWMYSDGWGGATGTTNVDCTGPHSNGCWGHRNNILATYGGATTIVAGTAAAARGPFDSYAELVLAGGGRAPALHYTWKQALAAGADSR